MDKTFKVTRNKIPQYYKRNNKYTIPSTPIPADIKSIKLT